MPSRSVTRKQCEERLPTQAFGRFDIPLHHYQCADPQALERYVSLSELEDALGTGAGLSRFNVCSTSMARSALDFLSSLAAMAVIPATSRSTASGPQRRTMPIPGIEAIGTSTSGGRAMALGLQVHTLETSV